MMRPRLLLAPYHGTERAYSGVGWEEYRKQALRARKAVGGVKVSWSPANCSSTLRSLKITSIAIGHGRFGCFSSRAERFRRIIREQFVKMYEANDVLAQVLEQAVRTSVRTRRACPTSRQIRVVWILRRFGTQSTRSPELDF